MITYKTIDKTTWPQGPWQDEPDKVSWTDEATGLPCLIVRTEHSGSLCGYVGVSPGHPCYHNNDPYELELSVHGGITYGAGCDHGPEAESICHIPDPGTSDDVYWLGFDTGHYQDYQPAMTAITETYRIFCQSRQSYRDLAYVKSEVESLARQLKALVP